MNLPEGTHLGDINNPLQDNDIELITGLVGLIKISSPQGEGVILVDHGKFIAASFTSGNTTHSGNRALEIINTATSGTMELKRFTADEYQAALETWRKKGLLLREISPPPAIPDRLDERILRKVLVQPGVIAVSAFSEGFSVQSLGEADFDQVAAMAEDLLRAGIKIAKDMNIGLVDQIILETGFGKIIIAPYGDLFLCVYTRPDVNLGLIRLVLKSIQGVAE